MRLGTIAEMIAGLMKTLRLVVMKIAVTTKIKLTVYLLTSVEADLLSAHLDRHFN